MLELWAPVGYVAAESCDCGRRGWHRDLIPDALLGLDITPACCIHDFMYSVPIDADLAYKEQADRVFLNNMLRLIENADSWLIVKKLRVTFAWLYYQAVVHFGGPSFWSGKNHPSNLVSLDLVKARLSDPRVDLALYPEPPSQPGQAS